MTPYHKNISPSDPLIDESDDSEILTPGNHLNCQGMAIDALELRAVRRRFLALNRDRLQRVTSSLQPQQQLFIELLPLLFHINHPMLPGFLNTDTPCGVSGFSPGKRCIQAARRLARSFKHLRRAQQVYAIHAIYIMGSTGTVAYSDQSDFDIWICHRPGLTPEDQQQIKHKAEQIKTWSETLGLEVHFFIFDDVSFRARKHTAISSENSGSSQHHLLLDEFYRTGLLIAGRLPVWWLVPPAYESCYTDYVRKLLVNRFIKTGDVIDFGGLHEIPVEEFFGATLWQLYKAVDSPYKSILKLLLLEAYAKQYPDIDILSMRFKQAVYDGDCKLNDIDPYVMMSNSVEEYLFSRKELDRLDLIRRCFYFKVNEAISRPVYDQQDNWRRNLMRKLVRQWGWGEHQLAELDQRKRWKIHRVSQERELLVSELTHSYRELSHFLRDHPAPAAINQADLNLLGRKLYVAFDRKPGKVDSINPGISRDLSEEQLSIHQTGNPARPSWVLYRGNPTARSTDTPYIKQSQNLLQLLAWCHLNRLINHGSCMLNIQPPDSQLNQWELRCLTDSLHDLFPVSHSTTGNITALNDAARLVKTGLFINIAEDPMEKLTRHGMQLVSDRIDPLSYGRRCDNLAIKIDVLAQTSWQELLTFEYHDRCAILECVCDLFAWSPIGEARPPDFPCFSFSTSRGSLIARRVEELFRDISRFFYRDGNQNGRYIVVIGKSFYVLQAENAVPRYTELESETALLDHLGKTQRTYSTMRFDPMIETQTRLAEICRHNRANAIQFFYTVEQGIASIYILDERGSLHIQQQAFHDETSLINPFQRFFESVLHRISQFENLDAGTPDICFYQLSMDADRQLVCRTLRHSPAIANSSVELQVIGEMASGQDNDLRIYYANREFSYIEYGDELYQAVALSVLEHRQGDATYPVYITDIDMQRSNPGNGRQQTVYYLKLKKQIEQQLNTVLEKLSP